MPGRAVVLFARTPEAEARVKALPRAAARLFETLIASWLREAESCGATPILACPPDARRRLSAIEPRTRREYVDQYGATFGDRLANAAREVSGRGFDAIVIAGIDAPPPSLNGSFALLERASVDAVIAPARDGGVNVIAFAEPPLDLLRTFTIDDATIAQRCRQHFARVHELEAVTDIDSVPRIEPARREHAWRPFRILLARCNARGITRSHVRAASHFVAAPATPRAPPAA
jgi:glycosyltransferase A (GT-A) superfamily protein (DUF2064 family)